MGSGKRNYNAMRQQYRKGVKKDTPQIKEEKKTVKIEDTQHILEMWKKAKEKQHENKS